MLKTKGVALSLPALLTLGCSYIEGLSPGTGTILCEGLLTNFQQDPANCGACGVTCDPDNECQLGSCVASRNWATFDVSSPTGELRREGSVLRDDSTGLVWAAETSEPLDRGGADQFCRQLVLDGHVFRVPTMIQLSTLFDYASEVPLTDDERVMRSRPEDLLYFQSSTNANGLTHGTIDFTGRQRGGSLTARVRCVALDLDARPMNVHYEDMGDTFLDTQTHLVWAHETSKPAHGGTDYVGPGSGSYDLADAKNYCERLGIGGFDDWRVPTTLELLSLYWVGLSHGVPYLDPIAVPAESPTQGSYFAIDEVTGFGARMSWIVDFSRSANWPAAVDVARRTRCVRGPVAPI